MKREHTQTPHPVILLIDGNGSKNKSVKNWLRKSRFLTCETTDVFQALEEISDFTMRSRPDVVLLEVESLSEDFFFVKEVIQTSGGRDATSIFALSESGKKVTDNECFEGNLNQVKAK